MRQKIAVTAQPCLQRISYIKQKEKNIGFVQMIDKLHDAF